MATTGNTTDFGDLTIIRAYNLGADNAGATE
jgi:hypothetical protein